MAWFAEQDGWFENQEVLDYYQRELDRVILLTYLEENISQKIHIERSTYEAFYAEHAEEFRGPDEVSMSILSTSDREIASEALARLRVGADFEFVRAEIEGRDPKTETGEASWSPVNIFNDEIAAELGSVEVGSYSDVLPNGQSWMIFRLDGRREGTIPPIEEVDGQIRQALYYQEFSRILDQHLARLEEHAEIIRHEDRIEEWARSGS